MTKTTVLGYSKACLFPMMMGTELGWLKVSIPFPMRKRIMRSLVFPKMVIGCTMEMSLQSTLPTSLNSH